MEDKRKVTVNRKHKDSLFRIIFKEKKELLSLYNALAGTAYENEDELTITTDEDVIYIHMKNDISFILDAYLNLYEHQSTVNPNMPMRGLLYMADLYKPLVMGNALYSKKIVKIPNPKYIVFYNGVEEKADRWELRLSDAFVHKESGGDIEVVAHMLNINYGHNKELMEKCEKLREYAILIATIRKYQEQGMDLEKAVSLALDECLEKGILTEILRKERAVIMNSILTEFDEEAYASMLRDEGFEDGREIGKKEGKIEGIVRMCISFGISKIEAVKKIKEELNISQEEAESYVEKYWDN